MALHCNRGHVGWRVRGTCWLWRWSTWATGAAQVLGGTRSLTGGGCPRGPLPALLPALPVSWLLLPVGAQPISGGGGCTYSCLHSLCIVNGGQAREQATKLLNLHSWKFLKSWLDRHLAELGWSCLEQEARLYDLRSPPALLSYDSNNNSLKTVKGIAIIIDFYN